MCIRALFPAPVVLALALAAAGPAAGFERGTLGFGRILNNDAIGDGRDRWRSGSYAISMVRGPGWTGRAPGVFGALLEYRLAGEIIAPEVLDDPRPGPDRRYAGALSLGVHTHVRRGPAEYSLGADLVFIGPQTGIADIQDAMHVLVGEPRVRSAAYQLGDALHPTLRFEVAREVRLAGRPRARLRPFVEVQAGVETLLRAGIDLTLGEMGRDDLRLRDPVTGQRIVAVPGSGGGGLSLLAGGDIAHVADSAYLPRHLGYRVKDVRHRVRLGLYREGRRSAVFYGLTWLGREFTAQREGQLVGSLAVQFRF